MNDQSELEKIEHGKWLKSDQSSQSLSCYDPTRVYTPDWISTNSNSPLADKTISQPSPSTFSQGRASRTSDMKMIEQ